MAGRWSVSEAKARFSQLLAKSREEPQLIESRGRPVAFVVAPDEIAKMEQMEREHQPGRRWSAFLRLSAEIRAHGGATIPRVRRSTRPSPFGS